MAPAPDSKIEQELAKLETVEIKDYRSFSLVKAGIDDIAESATDVHDPRLDALRRKLDVGVGGDEPRRYFDIEKAHAALEALGEDFQIVDKDAYVKANRRVKKLEGALVTYEASASAATRRDSGSAAAWKTRDELENFHAEIPSWKQQIQNAAPTFSAAARTHDKDVQLEALKVKVQREHQMHRLAAAHFKAYQLWFLLMPAALLTMLSGILAFLATSSMIGTNTKTFMTLVVGLLSLGSVFIQTINDKLNFGGRGTMHAGAVLDLKQVKDQLEFKQINDITGGGKKPRVSPKKATDDPAIGADQKPATGVPKPTTGAPSSNITDELEKGALSGKTVDTYNEIYVQIQSSCKSAVPLRIQQAFAMADSMLLSTLAANADDSTLMHDVNDWVAPSCAISHALFSDEFVSARLLKFKRAPRVIAGDAPFARRRPPCRFNSVRAMLYDHIYCDIAASPGFPIRLPNPHLVVSRVLEEINPCAAAEP